MSDRHPCRSLVQPQILQYGSVAADPITRWASLLLAALGAYPVGLLVALHGTRAVARLSLGHWPRPMLDDPKYINGAVSFGHAVSWIFMMGAFPVMLLTGAVLLWIVIHLLRRTIQLV